MSKTISMTISDEAVYLLDALCDKAHLTTQSKRGILMQQLIYKEISKIKVADRPAYKVEKWQATSGEIITKEDKLNGK